MQPPTESVIRNKIAAPCKIVNTKTQAKSIRNKQSSVQVFNIAKITKTQVNTDWYKNTSVGTPTYIH